MYIKHQGIEVDTITMQDYTNLLVAMVPDVRVCVGPYASTYMILTEAESAVNQWLNSKGIYNVDVRSQL
jgi:hypothetical protein